MTASASPRDLLAALPPSQRNLLELLIRKNGQACTPQEIAESLGLKKGSTRQVPAYIKRLRERIGDIGHIETVRNRGYRFVQATSSNTARARLDLVPLVREIDVMAERFNESGSRSPSRFATALALDRLRLVSGDLVDLLNQKTMIRKRNAESNLDSAFDELLRQVRPGEHVVAVSLMDADWWHRQGWWQDANRDAVDRGAILTRVFYLQPDDLVEGKPCVEFRQIMKDHERMGINVNWLTSDMLGQPASKDGFVLAANVRYAYHPNNALKRITAAEAGAEIAVENNQRWTTATMYPSSRDASEFAAQLEPLLQASVRFESEDWYDDYFKRQYQFYYNVIDEHLRSKDDTDHEVSAITKLLSTHLERKDRRNPKVLDVACGDGRISIPLSTSGYDVTGIDLQENLIDKLSKEYPEVVWDHGDMRTMCYTGFDAAISILTSFGYFSHQQNEEAFSRMASAVRPGGLLIVDLDNIDFFQALSDRDARRERDDSDKPSTISLGSERYRVRERHWYHRMRPNRRLSQFTIEHALTEDFSEVATRFAPLVSIQLYGPPDVRTLFERNGLDVLEIYGNWRPLQVLPEKTSASEFPRMIVVGRKRTSGHVR